MSPQVQPRMFKFMSQREINSWGWGQGVRLKTKQKEREEPRIRTLGQKKGCSCGFGDSAGRSCTSKQWYLPLSPL